MKNNSEILNALAAVVDAQLAVRRDGRRESIEAFDRHGEQFVHLLRLTIREEMAEEKLRKLEAQLARVVSAGASERNQS